DDASRCAERAIGWRRGIDDPSRGTLAHSAATAGRLSEARDRMAVDAKNDGGWIGRSIRRLEDPTLVAGHGRFTGDLPAARWVRFVRSSGASGRRKRVGAPLGATTVPAADLAAMKPIQPLLHKFNYVPISQPVLAGDVVRFVGEPIAAVVSSSREEAEDVADLVEVEIEELPAVVGAGAALAPRRPPRPAPAARHPPLRGPPTTAPSP